jgi:hypothetical protein
MFDTMLSQLETDLRAALGTCVVGLVATARAQLEGAHAEIATKLAQGIARVADERAKALAEVDAKRAELGSEIAAMHEHTEAQEGRVDLNIGGYRFETSVQTLRRVPHTFFDAYFSGRYAQDVCNDGSIFVDRDGEHFGHVLEYMRDGVVSVAETGVRPSVSLLRALKREFGFYCIELSAEEAVVPTQPEMVFVVGGLGCIDDGHGGTLSTTERYDVSLGQWNAVAVTNTRRHSFGACAFAGELYVTGGIDEHDNLLSSVEKYSPSSNAWSTVSFLPEPRRQHAQVAVGSTMYVLSGFDEFLSQLYVTRSVLKFDSVEGIWIVVADMPEPRYAFAACVVGSNIYVFGGVDTAQRQQGSVFKYDSKADEWSTLAPMPGTEAGHSATELGGLVYIVGAGNDATGLLRYDPASGVYNTLAPLMPETDGCHYGGSFVLAGCLYAAGGEGNEFKVHRYDVTANTWTEVSNMLEGRSHFGAVTIGAVGVAEEQDLFDALVAQVTRRDR